MHDCARTFAPRLTFTGMPTRCLLASLALALSSGCCIGFPKEQTPPYPESVDTALYVNRLASAEHAAEAAQGRIVVEPVGVIPRSGGLEVHLLVTWPGVDPHERVLPDNSAPAGVRAVTKDDAFGSLAPYRRSELDQRAQLFGRVLSDHDEGVRNIRLENVRGEVFTVRRMRRGQQGGFFWFDVRRNPFSTDICDPDGRWGAVQLVLVRTERDLPRGRYTLRLTRRPPESPGLSRTSSMAWMDATSPEDVLLVDRAVSFEVTIDPAPDPYGF